MSGKGSFQSPYNDYTNSTSNNILNDSKDGISEVLQNKLINFKATKIEDLLSKHRKDIFYDGTVYTGSAGLALYYLTYSSASKNEVSHENLQRALNYVDIENLRGRRISFLCGDAGPLAIALVISYKLGTRRPNNLPDYKDLAQRVMDLISLLDDSPDEILYGKAGYLYALLFVNKHISGKDVISSSHIEKVTSAIITSGKRFSAHMKSESPLLWQWHDKIYLGAAHGMAGILFMLLQARSYIKLSELRSFIKPAIDWLISRRFSSGNFPSSVGSSSGDRLVQWCHGAPGFVPLCIAAYQTFEDEKYLKIASQCGEVIWQRGLCTKGYSLCHGVSGNAYAFLQLYQITKKPVHLYRACCFMEWCAVERQGTELHHPDRPASLFEGLLGRIFLSEDIIRPLDSKFPAFCL
ncbi:lanC-like protein 2 [Colias croceus]|uniref:lanC-like protein 2 n=1 Tax=Colias crocea TaxID=72248 RepID=UPI001E27CBD5|nr:lanC-like protein 2 [Colias croceus]